MRDNCDLVLRWTWDPVKSLTGITNTGIREAPLTPQGQNSQAKNRVELLLSVSRKDSGGQA